MKKKKTPKVRVRKLSGYHFAYMRHIGPYGADIGKLWVEMGKWAAARDILDSKTIRLGLPRDNPKVVKPAKLRYDACVVVPKNFRADRDVWLADIPAGTYAVMEFSGTSRSVAKAWNGFLQKWLPKSGYQLDRRPCLELYLPRHEMNEKTGVFECSLCIPVKSMK